MSIPALSVLWYLALLVASRLREAHCPIGELAEVLAHRLGMEAADRAPGPPNGRPVMAVASPFFLSSGQSS
ncbi:MAG: hypothetical protein VW799_11275, partial [Halieaceae bacterium]